MPPGWFKIEGHSNRKPRRFLPKLAHRLELSKKGKSLYGKGSTNLRNVIKHELQNRFRHEKNNPDRINKTINLLSGFILIVIMIIYGHPMVHTFFQENTYDYSTRKTEKIRIENQHKDKSFDLAIGYGDYYLSNGQISNAIREYEFALELKPESEVALLRLERIECLKE